MDQQRKNLLLEHLPSTYRNSLLNLLEPVFLEAGSPIAVANDVPKYGHFVTSGMVSVVMHMRDGDGIEVGMVGSEGLAEAFQLLGSVNSPTRAFVQVDATALRMPFEALQREFHKEPCLRDVILQYVQTQAYTGAPLTACNRMHSVEQRLARWLLMVSDRVHSRHFRLTQEFLAEMLGVSRTTVTMVGQKLHQAGLLEYRRGKLELPDRAGLEGVACECYEVIRNLERIELQRAEVMGQQETGERGTEIRYGFAAEF